MPLPNADQNPGNQPAGSPSGQIMFVVMLMSAAMIVVLAILLPPMLEFDDFMTLFLRGVFFLVALGDVIIAFWFRSRFRKANPPSGGGTVQRQ